MASADGDCPGDRDDVCQMDPERTTFPTVSFFPVATFLFSLSAHTFRFDGRRLCAGQCVRFHIADYPCWAVVILVEDITSPGVVASPASTAGLLLAQRRTNNSRVSRGSFFRVFFFFRPSLQKDAAEPTKRATQTRKVLPAGKETGLTCMFFSPGTLRRPN